MIGGEDDPRLVDKNVPDYVDEVHMEDVKGLVDQTFEEFVNEFLRCAEVIYKTLEAEDHRHQYQLVGNTVSVAIRRLPYVKMADQLKKENHEYFKNCKQNEKVEEEGGDKGRTEQAEGKEESKDWNPA